MLSLVLVALTAVAVLMFLMWVSPKFKEMVASTWGWMGAMLLTAFGWFATWFTDAPVLPS